MIDIFKSLVKTVLGNATPGTIARTVCFFLALINQVLLATGHSILPITNDQVNQIVSVTFTVVTGLIAWWKNNSYTPAAVAADEYKKTLEEK